MRKNTNTHTQTHAHRNRPKASGGEKWDAESGFFPAGLGGFSSRAPDGIDPYIPEKEALVGTAQKNGDIIKP